jgi:hypothetical protein
MSINQRHGAGFFVSRLYDCVKNICDAYLFTRLGFDLLNSQPA